MKLLSRLVQNLRRILLVLALGAMAAIVAGMVLPLPSTLMLARWVTGKAVARDWRPLGQIAPPLVHAVIGAEDQRFCAHWGVDFTALREVLADDEGPSRGASTITMQTVKNVYLWPGQSYIRKGIEIPLALAVDTLWGKRRVIEVYLNVAEFGEGIFGAEAAAQAYFRVPASRLSSAQAARLAAALPNPRLRSPAQPSRFSRSVAARMESGAALAACVR